MPGSRPNILLIIADDFGIEQLGCTNQPPRTGTALFSTPNLDRLAQEGVRFNNAHAAAPVCSPARASLYTGLHPARLHLTDFIPGSRVINPPYLPPDWRRGLPVEVDTLGDIFKAEGYTTAHFGKWHLAPDYNYVPGRPMDPESQGFDEVFVTRKPLPNADPESDPHHIDALTTRTIAFCTQPRREPFLCVVAHNALHRPEIAPAALVAKKARHPHADPKVNRPTLAAMVEQLDAACGRLFTALRAAGRDRDTLIVFTSDHGPMHTHESQRMLRGGKADLYEGGLRVPLIMRWPQEIREGRMSDALVGGVDLFPTLLVAAGIPVPEAIDGFDMWPLVRGPGAQWPREALCWHYPHYHHLGLGPCSAILSQHDKLIEWFDPRPRVELFRLTIDPGEARDIGRTRPERRDELLRMLRAWRAEVGAQEMRPNPNFDPNIITEVLPPFGDTSASASR